MLHRSIKSVLGVTWQGCCNVASRGSSVSTTQHQVLSAARSIAWYVRCTKIKLLPWISPTFSAMSINFNIVRRFLGRGGSSFPVEPCCNPDTFENPMYKDSSHGDLDKLVHNRNTMVGHEYFAISSIESLCMRLRLSQNHPYEPTLRAHRHGDNWVSKAKDAKNTQYENTTQKVL